MDRELTLPFECLDFGNVNSALWTQIKFQKAKSVTNQRTQPQATF